MIDLLRKRLLPIALLLIAAVAAAGLCSGVNMWPWVVAHCVTPTIKNTLELMREEDVRYAQKPLRFA